MDQVKAKQLLRLSDDFYMSATRRMAELGVWDDSHVDEALLVIAAEYAMERERELSTLGLSTEDLIKAFRNYQ